MVEGSVYELWQQIKIKARIHTVLLNIIHLSISSGSFVYRAILDNVLREHISEVLC